MAGGRLLGATWPASSLAAGATGSDLTLVGDLVAVNANVGNALSCDTFNAATSVTAAEIYPTDLLSLGAGAMLQAANGSVVQLDEQATPPAGVANAVRLYGRDDGGKTELTAIFGTGAAQQVAQEP